MGVWSLATRYLVLGRDQSHADERCAHVCWSAMAGHAAYAGQHIALPISVGVTDLDIMSRPAISVVVASYNGERFIAEQLRSILAQLSPDDELIVSDDDSTDGTAERVERESDPRIRLLRSRQRVGYVRNFERGFAAARGSTIFLSDQDDVWLPGKVTEMMSALRAKACAASDAIVVGESLEQLHASYFEYRKARTFSTLEILMRPPVIGATLALRSAYLATLLPVPAGVPHDVWFSFNAAWHGELQIIRRPLILYRRHANVASPTASGNRRSIAAIVAERAHLLGAVARRRLLPAQKGRPA
jgi:glycosyltransferase involved in cell wall biosynthesis